MLNLFENSSSSDECDSDCNRRTRLYRERRTFNICEEIIFIEKFRVPKSVVQRLVINLEPLLRTPTNRNKSLTVEQKILIALHWFGTGAQYHSVGDMHGIGKNTVCRCVHEVTNAIIAVEFSDQVKWPENSSLVAQGFYRKGGMPEVCGVVDGILINIDAPSVNEQSFVDRHGNHSINCMAVCGPDLQFYYVSANWPGSVHDSRVLRNSTLFTRMEAGWKPFPDAVILGDSAYPLKE